MEPWRVCTVDQWSAIHIFDEEQEPDPHCSEMLYPVPEFIDTVFAKTSPKRSFSKTENERFGLVFVKIGSINSGTGHNKVKS
jgi:hypothetical protein